MTTDDGTLVATDERSAIRSSRPTHAFGQADRSWTEKVCAMAAARDGSLQVAFGVGKYPNRNVFDGYAGVCAARSNGLFASRRSSDEPDRIGVYPEARPPTKQRSS